MFLFIPEDFSHFFFFLTIPCIYFLLFPLFIPANFLYPFFSFFLLVQSPLGVRSVGMGFVSFSSVVFSFPLFVHFPFFYSFLYNRPSSPSRPSYCMPNLVAFLLPL